RSVRLDRQRRQAAVAQFLLGLGQRGGGAVGAHAHAVDGLAVGGARFDPCAQAQQGDAGLERFGIARGAERAGLEDVAGAVGWRRGGGRNRRGRGCAGRRRRRRHRRGGSPFGRGRVLLALALRGQGAALALGLLARAGGQLGIGQRHLLLGQEGVEIVFGDFRRGRRRGRPCGWTAPPPRRFVRHLVIVGRADRRLRGGVGLRAEEAVV